MDLGVSYVPAHNPQHLATDMRHLSDIGCSEVLYALQENHVDSLTGALRFGAHIAREHGLRPYAVVWGFANTFGGGRMSNRLLRDAGLWRQAPDGTRVPKACLNNPGVIDLFAEITAACRHHGFEGMFVDEPTPQDCFCPICQAVFAASYRGDLLASAGSPEYRAFQAATVSNYTAGLCRRVKAIDPGLRTITCIMPMDQAVFETVAAIPELDVFGTDPYWLISGMHMTIDDALGYAQLTRRICEQQHKSSQVWLNCWRIPAGHEAEIYAGGHVLASAGCDSLYTWSYRGGLGTYEECDNPELAWASVVRLYRELAGK